MLFCADFNSSTGILLSLPLNLTFKNSLMSRLPRPPNKKRNNKNMVAGFLCVLCLYFREMSSVSLSLQGLSKDWYSSFDICDYFTTSGILLSSAHGIFFSWKNVFLKITLMSAIWGFQLHVQFLMLGMSPHTPTHALKMVWNYWKGDMR